MAEWQPIETAPKDEADVLIYSPSDGVTSAYWSNNVWAQICNPIKGAKGGWVHEEHRTDTYVFQPTHWMPLPEPPQ